MAYTNPWSDTDPPGSQNANTIDDELRQLRLDIHERMDDIVDDWEDDPVVVTSGGAILSSQRSVYTDASAGGSKGSSLVSIKAHMFMAFTGTTSSSSAAVSINMNEISTLTGKTWNIATNGLELSLLGGRRSSDNVPIFMTIVGSSGVTNIFTLEFRYGDGALVNGIAINCLFLITAQTKPT